MENDGLVGDSSLLVLETSRIKSRDDGIQDQDYSDGAREKQKEEYIQEVRPTELMMNWDQKDEMSKDRAQVSGWQNQMDARTTY